MTGNKIVVLMLVTMKVLKKQWIEADHFDKRDNLG